MIVEPMTDAGLTKLSKRLLEYADRDVFGLYARDMRCVLARLASAEATISTLTAERDAAVARAMPEPRLLRTVEEVEALPEGHYFFNIPDRTFWTAVEKYCDDTWWMLGNECRVKPANLADSFYCIGPLRLPDLPTPTAAQED